MTYKLKPNYHFADTTELGIDKIPIGRLVIIEKYGPNEEIKWFKKVTHNLRDEQGNVIGTLNSTHTINDALTYRCIEAPLDKKADITSVYSQTEVDSMLTTKANADEVYTKGDVDITFRRIDDSYSATTVDSMLDNIAVNPKGIIQQANAITADVEIEYGNNAASLGPLTINNNVTVTIANGSVWTII
jgi:hypothetical protein